MQTIVPTRKKDVNMSFLEGQYRFMTQFFPPVFPVFQLTDFYTLWSEKLRNSKTWNQRYYMFLCSHEIQTRLKILSDLSSCRNRVFLPTELSQIPTLESQIYNRNRYRGISLKNSTLTQELTEGEKVIMGRVVYLRI